MSPRGNAGRTSYMRQASAHLARLEFGPERSAMELADLNAIEAMLAGL
jgi:hypothetical protein